jgi:hypothetical protein
MTPADTMRAAVEALRNAMFQIAMYGDRGNQRLMCERIDSALSLLRSALDEGGEPAQSDDVKRARLIAEKAQQFEKDTFHLGHMVYLNDLVWALKVLAASPIAADTQGDASEEAEFELHCNGDYEASAIGPREEAWREIQHYAAQYQQDGPVVIYEVKRTPVPAHGPESK